MRNRTPRRSTAIERLRLAVDCLPVATREAMLEGVSSSGRIIAGAYVDGEGGVCPMLAAHRRGMRTDFLSFARAWDRFTRAARGPRIATRRQVATLVALLEASVASASGLELDRAIAEHRALRSARMHKTRRAIQDIDPAAPIAAQRLRASKRPARSDDDAPTLAPDAERSSSLLSALSYS
jgi:hypothetical protein